MNRIIAFTIMAAALCLQPSMALAQETDSQAPEKVVPGEETSDRTPEKETPTPDPQVDQTKEGETSDRTPSAHDEEKAPDASDQ